MHRETTKGSHRLPFVASGLLLAMTGASAGCADVSGQALQQDVAQLRQDVNSLTLAVHRGRGDTDTVVGQLDRRTREQGAETSKQIAALGARLREQLQPGPSHRSRARVQEVLVAVVDTDVDVTHPDLADRIWQNAGEVGYDANGNDMRNNGIDDDANGYVDDWQGWNMISGDNSVRNGARAVDHAEQLNRLSGGNNVEVLDTLAAAYAEAGRFGEAVRTAHGEQAHSKAGASRVIGPPLSTSSNWS